MDLVLLTAVGCVAVLLVSNFDLTSSMEWLKAASSSGMAFGSGRGSVFIFDRVGIC